jgi:hypothetical protein
LNSKIPNNITRWRSRFENGRGEELTLAVAEEGSVRRPSGAVTAEEGWREKERNFLTT